MLALLLATIALAKPSLTLNDSTVVIPWEDFQKLYERGQAPDEKPKPAPRDFTLDRAVYSGRIVGEGEDAYALLRLSLRGQVHKEDGWTAVPLLSTAASLQAAKIDGRDGAVYIDGSFYNFVTKKVGPFSAELEFAVPINEAEGESSFALPLTATGATEVSFTVTSAEELTFDVPGAQGVSTTTKGNEHTVAAMVTANRSLTLSWHRKVTEEVAQARRVYAESQVLLGVGEGVLQGRAMVNYTVLHKGVEDLRVQLPKDVTVLEVEGPGIADWSQGADGVITVDLNYAALGAYRLVVDYERPLATGSAALPVPKVLDVTREKTWIGVDARSAVEVVAGAASGATPVDVRELPAAIVGQTDHPVLLAWKARGGDIQIPVEVKSHPDVDMLVTLVDSAIVESLVTDDGRRMTRVRWAVRNNRNQFLRVQLPATAEVWSASVAGRGVKVAKGDSGVLVPLVRSDASGGALSAFLVELVYVEPGEELGTSGEARVEIPRVDAPVSQLQWTVYFPQRARIGKRSYDGTVRHVTWFSGAPTLPPDASVTPRQTANVRAAAAADQMAGTLGQGVEPVEVSLPLAGQTILFEKMLVLDEPLWISFEYRLPRAR